MINDMVQDEIELVNGGLESVNFFEWIMPLVVGLGYGIGSILVAECVPCPNLSDDNCPTYRGGLIVEGVALGLGISILGLMLRAAVRNISAITTNR